MHKPEAKTHFFKTLDMFFVDFVITEHGIQHGRPYSSEGKVCKNGAIINCYRGCRYSISSGPMLVLFLTLNMHKEILKTYIVVNPLHAYRTSDRP